MWNSDDRLLSTFTSYDHGCHLASRFRLDPDEYEALLIAVAVSLQSTIVQTMMAAAAAAAAAAMKTAAATQRRWWAHTTIN